MPICTVCKTTEGLELYKGQFRCPDHIGTLEEIKDKRPVTLEDWIGPAAELHLAFNPEDRTPSPILNKNLMTDAWIQKEEAKRKRKEEQPIYRVVTGKEIAEAEIRIRYGSPGAKE